MSSSERRSTCVAQSEAGRGRSRRGPGLGDTTCSFDCRCFLLTRNPPAALANVQVQANRSLHGDLTEGEGGERGRGFGFRRGESERRGQGLGLSVASGKLQAGTPTMGRMGSGALDSPKLSAQTRGSKPRNPHTADVLRRHPSAGTHR